MLHLWPRGRIVRICVMVLGGLIAADLGYFGAWGAFGAYLAQTEGGGRGQLILGCVYAACALASLVIGLVAAGFHKRAVEFLIQVEDEMIKVTWPKPNELWRSTLVIALAIAVIAGIVFLADLGLYKGLKSIFEAGSKL
jgi:preprotein translocase SecE subunit